MSSEDVVLRVSAAADVGALQAQLQFLLGDKAKPLRRAVPGQRWWRFGPLRDAELWVAKEMVARTGLVPLRDELRTARAGPFRSYVYFAASGTPSRMGLDDGSWGASEACLAPADPPPRRTSPSQAARPRGSGGSALAPQSSWAGARPAAPPCPPARWAGQKACHTCWGNTLRLGAGGCSCSCSICHQTLSSPEIGPPGI